MSVFRISTKVCREVAVQKIQEGDGDDNILIHEYSLIVYQLSSLRTRRYKNEMKDPTVEKKN